MVRPQDGRPAEDDLPPTVDVGPQGSAETPHSPTTADTPSATSLGRYVVVAEAGGGGMGIVLRAYDPKLRREVALKRVRDPDLTQTQVTRRVLREARAIARLSHPNVIAVYDVEEIGDATFVVMEYVEGVTLREWTRAAPRDWRALLGPFVEAARGLAAAHGSGLIHRDFKPDNVMIGVDGRARVLDFGLAREDLDGEEAPASLAATGQSTSVSTLRGDRANDTMTAAGTVMGTIAYMAPEQLGGVRVDASVDQYAWCVALWEALWGERPFVGDMSTVLRAKRRGPGPPPQGSTVPRWLVDVLQRGLAPVAADRFGSMMALVRAIERGRTRWRSRTLAAVALGLVATGVAVEVWRRARQANEVEACEIAGREIESAWGEPRREQLRAAMLASGVGHVEVTFDARLRPRPHRQRVAQPRARRVRARTRPLRRRDRPARARRRHPRATPRPPDRSRPCPVRARARDLGGRPGCAATRHRPRHQSSRHVRVHG